jgi:uncharacterized membrane protein YkvA (DUF1232 family)
MATEDIAEEFVTEEAKKITDQDMEKVLKRSEEIKKQFRRSGPLGRFVEDGQLLVGMVKDYWSRSYRRIPSATVAAAVVSLLYVLNPLDLVPDVLPLIGQVDDAAVVAACLLLIEQDLYSYRQWKQTQAPGKDDAEDKT